VHRDFMITLYISP